MPKRQADFPDLSQIEMPDPDAEALKSLQYMDDIMRPLVVTPQEERFPPLPPTTPEQLQESRQRPSSRRPRHHRRNNFITLIFSLLTLGVCGYYGVIWGNPQSALNPLAPPTPFQIVTATVDSNPVFVPSPQPALTDGQPTRTPSFEDLQPFAIAPEGVLYVSNQNGRGCNWTSIAGTVMNSNNEPLPGFGIRVTGDSVSATVYSGTNSTFGAGGYEVNLGSAPTLSNYTVQLVTTGGAPLSSELIVTTREDCSQNVAIVNFIQR